MSRLLVFAPYDLGGASYLWAFDPLYFDTTYDIRAPWDAVLFTGGCDVSPHMYGDTSPKKLCSFSRERDAYENAIWRIAAHRDAYMYGICRGAQFLNVKAGGTLIHDIGGHCGLKHPVNVDIQGPAPKEKRFQTNSLHHQMCITPPSIKVEAWAEHGDDPIGKNDEPVKYKDYVEAISGERMFAVQWHPEMLKTSWYAYQWFNFMALKVAGRAKEYQV